MRPHLPSRAPRAAAGIGAALAVVAAALAPVGAASAAPAPSPAAIAAPVIPMALPVLNGEPFDRGNIIADDNFYDAKAMTAAQIQTFLDGKIGACTNGQCLNVIKVTIPNQLKITSATTGNTVCEAMTGGTMSAATLIYRVQVACTISAKVILVTLQKEQGLVTKKAPTAGALKAAMGMGCPDTAPCSDAYSGLASQIYSGAKQLKTYKAGRFAKQPGVQAIRYHPNSSCGSVTFDVKNYATAALYSYTPYTPNTSALTHLRTTGDSCSSYGNRNFWVYYNDWFGSPIDIPFAKAGTAAVSGATQTDPASVGAAGDVLVGSASGWSPSPTAFAYQWYRDGAKIAGATSKTYTLLESDIGHSIRVNVAASRIGRKTSDVPSPTLQLGTQFSAAPTPKIAGSTVSGETLTVDTGTWSAAPDALAIQWLRDGAAISGATGTSYTTAVADRSHTISARVTATKAGYFTTTKTSAATGTILARFVVATPTAAAASGPKRPTVGYTLAAGTTGWLKDGVPLEGGDFAYQWYRSGTAISGATKATYTLVAADAGKTMKVKVTGRVAGFASASATSAATASVGKRLASPRPSVSGVTVVGGTLTAVTGTWTTGTKLTYQWLRDGAAISGATGASRKLAAADLGATISVRVTGTKSGYTGIGVTSDPVGPVATEAVVGATPTIAGSAVEGSTITASPGTWSEGATLAYQWLRGGAAISGATGPTYLVAAADAGKRLSVRVTGSLSGLATISRTSSSTAVVLHAFSDPGAALSVSAETGLIPGKILTAVRGTWDTRVAIAYSYAWYRDGTRISGQTQKKYTLAKADVGHAIKVVITGTAAGYRTASASATTAEPVAAKSVVAATPTISGLPAYPGSLTAAPGTWSSGAALAYQWYRNGAPIATATGATYALVAGDLGAKISVTVTGSLSGYATLSRTSAATPTVLKAFATPTASIKVYSGGLAVGQPLVAAHGTWDPVATPAWSFVWYRDGEVIAGQSDYIYDLTAADVGHDITVRITGTASGYATVGLTTEPVGPITAG